MIIIRRKANTEDLYHSFYCAADEGKESIKTYYDQKNDEFQALIHWNETVIFKKSDSEADEKSLVDAELSCYPNPFNHRISIEWLSLLPINARISVYNILGQEIYQSSKRNFNPGLNMFHWNAVNSIGMSVPSGIYFIRLESGSQKILLKKVTLLK